jgi:beta-glucosidase
MNRSILRRRFLLSSVPLMAFLPGICAGAVDARSVDDRTTAIIEQLTFDEKLRLFDGDTVLDGMTGVAKCVGHVTGVKRLGLPDLCMGDGPAGVGNGLTGVTQFPAPIALAASWDRSLAHEFGVAMGGEHAAKGRNVVLAPTVNIIRTPLWGRMGEALSEDPYLTAQMATPIVIGIQSNHVIAMPKHFVANNQEWLRLGDAPGYEAINAIVSERALREIYYPAFHAVTADGGAGSLMCAYNRVNGSHACENAKTLAVPRREWGFDGFVVADWLFAHRSTVAAARAGLDISMPGGKSPFGFEDFYGQPLKDAVANGSITMDTINIMARHIVQPMVRIGLLDHPVPSEPAMSVRSDAHLALARRISAEGIVLLRNEGRVLPLADSAGSIAVIGDDGGPHIQTTETYGGFVTSKGIDIPSPLDAIRMRAGKNTRVTYAQGTAGIGPLPVLEQQYLRTPEGKPGLRASYFPNAGWEGAPSLIRNETVPNAGSVRPAELPATFSARWEGKLTPPKTGLYRFSLTGGGEIALMIDGKRVAYAPRQNFSSTFHGTIALSANSPVSIQIVYSSASTVSAPELRIGWQAPDPLMLEKAVSAAKASQMAIVFVSDAVSEGADRANLSLPGDQDALIEAVAAANPRTIVVLNTVGPVLMPWKNRVSAILAAWYGGEQAAPALTSILFGDTDPSGRLPVTFPTAETEMATTSPELYRGKGTEVRYDEDLQVGYRWYNSRHQRPLYSFGFGLSYTDYKFSKAQLIPDASGGWIIKAKVRNIGHRAGTVVPQLYVTFPTSAQEPPRQLKAFDKLTLNAGEENVISLPLPRSAIGIWDQDSNAFRAMPGKYRLEIGTSVDVLPLSTTINVPG